MKTSIVDLPRKKDEVDLFGIQKYQNALVEFISQSQTPLTIALQGEWGSGKTSLMNLLEEELCNANNSPYYRVWINSWQYSLMRTPEEAIVKIVGGIIEQIIDVLTDSKGKNETIVQVKSLLRKIAVGGGKFLAKQLVDTVGGNSDFVDDLFSGKGSDGAEISQMKNKIAELIKKVLEQDSAKKGFLFFIDDLDRIDPPIAVQILELLKNIFDLNDCIFILAIDYDVVIKGLEPKFGKLNEKNEREFRSFFDKIIQMPFSMPVSSYTIDVFLVEALKHIGFINEDESKDTPFVKDLSEFAGLSVGHNPRALKRLTNTLSLINIINKKSNEENHIEHFEKLIGFAMVCLQIAYPYIYNKLSQDSDFDEWNENTATKLKLDALKPEQIEQLNANEEFDDTWEKVLFQMAQKETYSSNRVFQISALLNKVKSLIPNGQDLGSIVSAILEQSAVTNIVAFDKPKILQGSRAEVQNRLKDFVQINLPSKLKAPLIKEIKILSKSGEGRFTIRTGISKDQLKNWAVHSINVLVTTKNEMTNCAINFSSERWPKDPKGFIELNNNNYSKCLDDLTMLSKKHYNDSFSITENVRADSKVVYQVKTIIEFADDINSEKNSTTIVNFLAEWASIVVDFSRKIGWQ